MYKINKLQGYVVQHRTLYSNTEKPLFYINYKWGMGFPSGSVVKNPPAMQEMWLQSLGWGDSLEKEMATHSSLFAWEIPRTEESGRL